MAPPDDETHDPERCTPCRGTGKVISRLGGDEHTVTCPWCGGTGRRDPQRDAQAHPAEQS
jgi:DnaJ-class molecular chaperone